jgi:hypothetical protein
MMQKASDAMVSVNDLDQAVDEKRRGYSEATMKRLFKTEPYLAVYIESLAMHFGHPPQQKENDLDGAGKALDKLLVIVRAIEIGQYRLWRGSIPPSSPLGRMITGDQQHDQHGAK